jgi:hypothetical protein
MVPVEVVRVDPGDPRRANGYLRMLHHLERHGTTWVEFDLGHPQLARKVVKRLKKHPMNEGRYEFMQVHDLIFARRVEGASTEIQEAICGEGAI